MKKGISITTRNGNKTSIASQVITLGKKKVNAQCVTTKTGSRLELSSAVEKRILRARLGKNPSKAKKAQLKLDLAEVDSDKNRLARVTSADRVASHASDIAIDAVTKVATLKNGTKKYTVIYSV